MALSTSCNFEPRAPSTASKPALTPVNVDCDCFFTTHTVINNPLASATEAAVTTVDNACCRKLRRTMLNKFTRPPPFQVRGSFCENPRRSQIDQALRGRG